MNRKFDIILWGATGFTGKLVAEYFLREYGLNKSLNWGIAGRNKKKLEKLRFKLKSVTKEALDIPILIGDSHEIKSLNKIVKQTKVICSTVGPYMEYGMHLVKVCIDNDTDYCDITGETPFIKTNIESYHTLAVKKRIKIVHCCGYDSIPSDLGCLMVQDFSIKTFKNPCENVLFYVGKTKGGFSGGTIASMINMTEKSKFDKKMRALLKDPYALNSQDDWKGHDDLGQRDIKWDSNLEVWTGPFIMAMINTRIVRRTNVLLNLKYGENFSYQEVMTFPPGYLNKIRAKIFRLSLGFIQKVLRNQILRFILKKYILPSSGQGPSKSVRENGFFNVIIIGKGYKEDGTLYKVKGNIYCDRDPGYAGTARMLGESAICLSLYKKELPDSYGVLTPAAALGKILIKNLKQKGMKFNVGIYN
tara:strand:+ start:5495 stop:6748 length:1254 start_codon:yes stop_codon:yes gene_type:complete